MPRLARLDAPGVLHHVIGRGIERRKIFLNNRDRNDFVARLGELAEDDSMDILSQPRLFPQLNPNLKYQYEWEYQMRWAFYWVPMREAG